MTRSQKRVLQRQISWIGPTLFIGALIGLVAKIVFPQWPWLQRVGFDSWTMLLLVAGTGILVSRGMSTSLQRVAIWLYGGLLGVHWYWHHFQNVYHDAGLYRLQAGGSSYLLLVVGLALIPRVRAQVTQSVRGVRTRLDVGSSIKKHVKRQTFGPAIFRRHPRILELACLVLILGIFTLLKQPYFGLSFTGEHNLKYAWTVEIAQHMSERNDPLWFQTRYVLDPINNPSGMLKNIDVLPLMEWGIYGVNELLPMNSIEFNTRIFTHLIGVAILICAYVFFRSRIGRGPSLLTIGLLSVSPIFVFGTYVTVYDSVALLAMFVSFIMLDRSSQNKSVSLLYWAGGVLGIGVAVKFSMFLWATPIALFLLWQSRNHLTEYFFKFFVYVGASLLPLITIKLALRGLTVDPQQSLAWGIGGIGALWILQLVITRYQELILRCIRVCSRLRVLGLSILVVGIVVATVILRSTGLDAFGDNFLTDHRLIANPELYYYMVQTQFQSYLTNPMFILGLISLGLIWLVRWERGQAVSAAFGVGVLVYWIAASKVIFFHNYYTLIIVIFFSLLGGIGLYFGLRSAAKPSKKVFIAVLISVLVLWPMWKESRVHIAQHNPDFEAAAEYLKSHTGPDDLYLDDDSASSYFVLRTGRGRVWRSHLALPEVRESIQRLGFQQTMEKYNIVYLVSQRTEPNYFLYANMFTEEKLESNTVIDRGRLILSVLSGKAEQFSDSAVRERIIKEHDLPEKFVLEKVIGTYHFYRFQD